MLFQLGPGSFLDLINQNNYHSNWKKSLGFRNLQEKSENLFLHILGSTNPSLYEGEGFTNCPELYIT